MAQADTLEHTRWHYDPQQPHLADYPAVIDDSEYLPPLEQNLMDIGEHQRRLRANGARSLLLVFHGLDASGKDSLIRVLATRMDPAGFHAWSFGRPHGPEAEHDFLWRIVPRLPAFGEVVAFNRGHHEAVIAERAWPVRQPEHYDWPARYAALRHFEAHLVQEGTTIRKFWLHLSEKEHRQRLRKRLDRPHKRWKFNAADIEAWERRTELLQYTEEALAATHCARAPWFIIPADNKPAARTLVAAIVADELKTLAPTYPEEDHEVLAAYRKQLKG